MRTSVPSDDLQLAFDVGHSSLGWAVLKTNTAVGGPNGHPAPVDVIGCGAVTFGADDCLASKRRLYRRQRRHARATRQRIGRLEKLLAHLGVLTAEQLAAKHQQAGGHSAPWLLAARVLASNGDTKHLLAWPQLLDVLRWYAHNRGYDGNRRWSTQETLGEAEDTEKEQNAIALMQKHGATTMAETLCKELGLDPLGKKQSSDKPFKRLNAAFPRPFVEKEVRRILQAHFGKLPRVDGQFEQALFDKWEAIPCPDIKLPKRFQGGMLFGQLVPRFDNRIIATCPLTGGKVPNKSCPEFLNFRWAMLLANIKVATASDRELRKLTVEERKAIHEVMLCEGALTESEMKKLVRRVTGCVRDKLDQMFMEEVNAKEALILDPVQKLVRGDLLLTLWPTLSPRVQKRARDAWQRGKSLTPAQLHALAEKLNEPTAAFDAEINRLLDASTTKKSKKQGQFTRESLLAERFAPKKIDGRAAYARPMLKKAAEEVMAGKHPKEEGGCLFITEEMRHAQIKKSLAEQTNNHLVRHRLLILERLQADLIKDYAGGDKVRIARMTIEVNRDLREFSGKTAKAIAQDLGQRLSNFKSVSAKLEEVLAGKNINITAGLIRKARIAEDLGWMCPYTGQSYDTFDLITRKVDRDHIVPYSQRPSNSLDSLAITFSEVNRMKGQRTAWQFVAAHEGQPVAGMPNLSIVTRTRFKEFVEKLESWKGHDDDKRRKKKRKDLLLLEKYEEKGFTPRDLTVTSQLVRLGAQVLKKPFLGSTHTPVVISLPGALTGSVRKGWKLIGCLSLAAPQVLDENGEVKTKTDIRSLTHLHHALDACVLALASHYLPNNGSLWEIMIKRNHNDAEKAILRATGYYHSNGEGRFELIDLPDRLKDQIRQRLAEKRVVQHIPADMSGMKVEENTRGVVKVENGRVYLRKRTRDAKTGKLSIKPTDEVVGKVVGLEPRGGQGKLTPMKGVRVISENFGVAILDHATNPDDKFIIIPWHKVWHRLAELKEKNGGKRPTIVRNGQLIRVRSGKRAGLWRVISVKQTVAYGLAVDLALPDSLDLGRGNAPIETLVKDGLELLRPSLTGIDASKEHYAQIKKRASKATGESVSAGPDVPS